MLASIDSSHLDAMPKVNQKMSRTSYRRLYNRVLVTDTVPHLARPNEMFLNTFEQDDQGKTRGTKSELLRKGKNGIVDVRCFA